MRSPMAKKKPRADGGQAASPSPSSPRRSSRRGKSPSRPVARRGRDLLREREDVGFRAESELIEVGRLGRPWGVRGAINLRLHAAEDDLSWADDVLWLRGEGFPLCAVEVEQWLEKGSRLLLRFAGIHSPQDVSALTHLCVLVPRDWLPEPEEDEHYVHELIGMEVVDELRGALGTIQKVFATGANDVWVVRGEAGEELIPAIKTVVLEVDTEARRVRVRYELV